MSDVSFLDMGKLIKKYFDEKRSIIDSKIELKDNETGYDVIMDKIFEHNINIPDDIIVSIEVSYDGIKWEGPFNELLLVGGYRGDEYEWLRDWWEGQKYIRLHGFKFVRDVCVCGE